ncbi:MAG: glutaredoxin 3 [Thermodesulfobacteriota bacterium]
MTKAVEIYTTGVCPYCIRAKALLDKKKIAYAERRVDETPAFADEAVRRSGGRTTVPQIFINGVHVGGCDELYALEREKKLDALLPIPN